jgi:DNA-binding MarR family transcriptional regulator
VFEVKFPNNRVKFDTAKFYDYSCICKRNTISHPTGYHEERRLTLLDHSFENCLYFTTSTLNRAITRMAEEEFRSTGLSPTYAFLIMVLKDKPGISQKQLGEILHVTPSTITRFIEKLEYSGYVTSRTEGKLSLIDITPKGLELMVGINKAWDKLHERYDDILGPEEGKQFTKLVCETNRKLTKKN